ncbi:calmodulin-like protein 3 [Coffea eugenioides]|uniref:Calmodulin-like protein 3 n=1 Tax=Coffea arabica TaxID=13443 RepID=A0A6P6T228_COFAR|nr:calmodulin-like protein 3 [Coffea arabica]XP_027176881.1 calmodulin-like protein 3 [Coffea eugenioides]
MWTAILLLVLLFVAGLISTNFNRKMFLAWFQSYCAKIRNPSSHAANSFDFLETKSGKKVDKRSGADNKKVQLRSIFATFDKNNDGYITEQELKDSLNNIGMGMTESDIADMVRKVDSNGDGLIDLEEFCESFDSLIGRGEMNEEEQERDANDDEDEEVSREDDLKEAFAVFDGNKDGLITVEELGLVLSSLGFKEGKKLEDCIEMIRKVDVDGDGMVNFDEFKRMMKAGHRLLPAS